MMLSSTSQYLHPDYLQPLPTTLDSKKSPLALLAQTCSAIGKDTTPSKPIIPPLEKKGSNGDSQRDSSSHKSDSPSSKSPRTPTDGERKESRADDHASEARKRDQATSSPTEKSSFRVPAPKDIPPLVPISSSSPKTSPRPSSRDPASPKSERDSDRRSPRDHLTSTSSTSSSRLSLSTTSLLDSSASADPLAKATMSSSLASLPGLRPESLGSHLPPSLYPPPGCGYPGLLSGMHAVDAASSAHMHAAALSHSLAGYSAKHGLTGLQTVHGVSPYTYARVKTTTGGTTLVPICRDPYCTNCQVTMQTAQLNGACAAGCTQCNHDKSLSIPTSISSGLAPTSLGTLPVLSMASSGLPSSHLASSLYSHAFGVLPGHQTQPYVCNWVTGSDYCGRRFSSSEELLTHLRSHSSSSEHAAALSGLPYAALGLNPAALAAAHSAHYPPGSLSPNSLRQTYPRSLSPSLLAASRYHPYKSPLSALPTPPGFSGLPAGLAAYYPPYSALYSQRLGAVP